MTCFGEDGVDCTFASLGNFLDHSGKVGRVEVLRCQRCGHGISMPPIPDVRFLYEDRESQDYQPDSKGLSHVIKSAAFRFQAKRLLKQIGLNGSILDFGCGSGQFTRVLGEIAEGEVFGSDMHAEPPADLTDRRYLGTEELDDHRGQFDVVLAMHVVEHEEDADTLVRTIASFARQGGKVVIEVPNVDCIWARPFGKYWDAWYLPYHRQHFTAGSITRLMGRNGLKIDRVCGITVPTMGRTFANLFGSSNNLFWLLCGIVVHPIQLMGEVLAHKPSAVRVIATKVVEYSE